jgi:heme exporter protein D
MRKRQPVKTYRVRGYEIPAANPQVLLHLAGLLLMPLGWLGVAWWLTPESPHRARLVWAALVWTALWVVVVHVRNIGARREVERGEHDPLYGPHLRRMRQREYDKSKTRKFNIALTFGGLALVAAVVGLKAVGIDLMPAPPTPIAGPSLEHAGH